MLRTTLHYQLFLNDSMWNHYNAFWLSFKTGKSHIKWKASAHT